MSMSDKIWILNPDYVFKNDGDRICMFAKKDLAFDSSPNWIGYIHPSQAMILSVFTELRPANEIVSLLAHHFNVSVGTIGHLIKDFMGNKTPVYTVWQGIKVGFPKNVLVQLADGADMPQYHFSAEDLKCSSVDLTPDRSHRAPHSALWMLTNKCVTNCKYCYADRKTQHEPLATDRILEIIDEFAALRMGYVDIIGGEIFLHKDWDIILKSLVEKGMSPTYISTKVPITPSIMNRLLSTGYNKIVQISLDSLYDETLSKIIGTSIGYVEKVKMGIALLERHNYPIQIDTILTTENSSIAEITSLYNYIKEIKHLVLWEIRVPDHTLYASESFSKIKASAKTIRGIQQFVENRLKVSSSVKIVFSSEVVDEIFRADGPEKECFKGGACGVLQNRLFILPDGKVSICEQMYWHKDFIIGDLKTTSIEKIWNSQRAVELFHLPNKIFRDCSPCKKCLYFEDCNTKKRRCVVKVIKAYGTENWDFPDPRCKFAPPLKNDLTY